jgi:hypothetical protein
VIYEEFIKQIVPKYILKSMSGTLFTSGGEGVKQGADNKK